MENHNSTDKTQFNQYRKKLEDCNQQHDEFAKEKQDAKKHKYQLDETDKLRKSAWNIVAYNDISSDGDSAEKEIIEQIKLIKNFEKLSSEKFFKMASICIFAGVDKKLLEGKTAEHKYSIIKSSIKNLILKYKNLTDHSGLACLEFIVIYTRRILSEGISLELGTMSGFMDGIIVLIESGKEEIKRLRDSIADLVELRSQYCCLCASIKRDQENAINKQGKINNLSEARRIEKLHTARKIVGKYKL
jgi:hypothetical protein